MVRLDGFVVEYVCSVFPVVVDLNAITEANLNLSRASGVLKMDRVNCAGCALEWNAL